MRTTLKTTVLVAALGVSTLALREAVAGNYLEPAAEYYSLELTLGDYLSHSDPEAVVLVDDVTYSCEWAPCDATEDCSFFGDEDLPWNVGTTPGTPPGQGIFLHPGGSVTPGLRPVYPAPPPGGGQVANNPSLPSTRDVVLSGMVRSARGAFGEVVLVDSDGESHQTVIDRFSFSANGATADLHRLQQDSFNQGEFQFFWDPGSGEEPPWEEEYGGGVGIGVSGSGDVGLGLGTDLVATLVSFPSSGSRHYQSPHIVTRGRVYLEDWGGGTMSNAVACVKGRVILSPATPPTVSTGVTVTWP